MTDKAFNKIAAGLNQALGYAQAANESAERIAELEQAIKAVIETFELDEAQGYRSRDRQYAIEVLRKVVTA